MMTEVVVPVRICLSGWWVRWWFLSGFAWVDAVGKRWEALLLHMSNFCWWWPQVRHFCWWWNWTVICDWSELAFWTTSWQVEVWESQVGQFLEFWVPPVGWLRSGNHKLASLLSSEDQKLAGWGLGTTSWLFEFQVTQVGWLQKIMSNMKLYKVIAMYMYNYDLCI